MQTTSNAAVAPALERRISELDGVRGLAIALVLLFHYGNVNVPGNKLLNYAFLPTQLMWSGVDLFFVLSGLLIGGVLLDHRESPGYYAVFYARRIHRIFPIYYLMIALLILGAWEFPHSPLFVGGIPLWTFPLYAQNLTVDFTQAPIWIGVSWSLAVEEQFYLVLPLLVRLVSRRALLYTLGGCIVGAPLLRAELILHGWGFEQVHALLPCRADSLALGVVAAIMTRSENAKQWVKQSSRRLYGCLLGLVVLFPTMLKWATYQINGTIGYSILGVTYFLFILLLLLAPLPGARAWLNASWLRWLGTVSYCVYLIHVPVREGLLLLFGLGGNSTITGLKSFSVMLVALAVTFGLAQLSWMLVEKRLIKRAHVRYRY